MSRADRFDRADFETRYTEPARPPTPPTPAKETAPHPTLPGPERGVMWPIAPEKLQRVGESVLAHRKGTARPHKGIDLFADPGTEVRAARGGSVLRVVDGRNAKGESLRRAGLFVDVRGTDALVYRYLHLHDVRVEKGTTVWAGTVLGRVAPAHTSGLADAPHLHFEIRQGDYDRGRKDYGPPVDPLRLLPPLHHA